MKWLIPLFLFFWLIVAGLPAWVVIGATVATVVAVVKLTKPKRAVEDSGAVAGGVEVRAGLVVNPSASRMRTDLVGAGASLDDLCGALFSANADVGHDFAHCTPRERRGMVAMRLHQLFRWIAGRYPHASREALGYDLIAHAWWTAGLVLQRDRREEVKVATAAATWAGWVGDREMPAEQLAWVVRAGPGLKDEAAVDAFSAELWRRLGIDAKTRHKP